MAELNDLLTFLTGAGVIFTGIGVIVSIDSMKDQIKHVRTGWQIDLLLKFEERFDGNRMIQERLTVSKFLLTYRELEVNDPQWSTVDNLVDFFQSIGTFVEENIMEIKFVSNFFGHWMLHYFKAIEPYILHVRNNAPGTWQQALNLYAQVKSYDLKHGSLKGDNISREELEKFLQWEMRMDSSHSQIST